jgi:hypothetical protein
MRKVSALLHVAQSVLITVAVLGIVGAAEAAPPVSECDLCLSVSEASPHACRPAGSVIAPDTRQLFARIRLEGPIYEAHEVLMQWFDPVFGLYAENTISIPGPESAGYGWWNWYIAWGWVDIAGDPAAERPGPWRVDAYVDGQLKCSKTFTMDVSSALRETLERETRDALSVGTPTEGGDVTIRIGVGPEAAGFFYVVLYDTERAKGSFFGEDIGLGPHAEPLDFEGQLDEQGAATLVVPWPAGALEYYFQVLVAVDETEFAEGRFWQSEPIHQKLPPPPQTSDGEPEFDVIAVPDGADDPFGMPGNDPLYGCAGESPFVLDECLRMQIASSGLRCDSEVALRPVPDRGGYVTVSGDEGVGGPVLCWLSAGLPAVSCCTALQLREFRICYQCLTAGDRIESIEIGYLSDGGSFEVLTTIETDLTSTAWDCAAIALNGAIAPRPLVFRFSLILGGGAAGGVRFGNMAAALAPQDPRAGQVGLPGRIAPAGVPCASLCVGSLEDVFSSTERFVHCADGFDLGTSMSPYEAPPPTFLVVAFTNNCGEEIRCTRLEILDDQGATVWSGSGYVALPGAGTPQEWGRWDVGGVPGGTYQVVAQTNLGEFRTRVRITR